MKEYTLLAGGVFEHRKRTNEPAVRTKLFFDNFSTMSALAVNSRAHTYDVQASIDLTAHPDVDGRVVENSLKVNEMLNTIIRQKISRLGVIYNTYRIFVSYEWYAKSSGVDVVHESGIKVFNGVADELIRPLPLDSSNKLQYTKSTVINFSTDFKSPMANGSIYYLPYNAFEMCPVLFFRVTSITITADTYEDPREFKCYTHPSRMNNSFRIDSDTCAAMMKKGTVIFTTDMTAYGNEILKKLNIDICTDNYRGTSTVNVNFAVTLDLFTEVYNEVDVIKLINQNKLERERPADNKPPVPTPKPPYSTVTVLGNGKGCTLDATEKAGKWGDNIKFILDVTTTAYFKLIVIDGVKYDTFHDVPKCIATMGYTHGNSFVITFENCKTNHSFYIVFDDVENPDIPDPGVDPTPDDPKSVYDIRVRGIGCRIDHGSQTVNVGEDAVFVCDFESGFEFKSVYINGTEYTKTTDIPEELGIEIVPLIETAVAYKFTKVTQEFLVSIVYDKKETTDEPGNTEDKGETSTENTPTSGSESETGDDKKDEASSGTGSDVNSGI